MDEYPSLLSKVRIPYKYNHVVSTSRVCYLDDGTWEAPLFTAHATGCNAISWSPSILPGSLINPQIRAPSNTSAGQNPATSPPPVQRFITAGSDNLLKIWILNANTTSGSFSTPAFDGANANSTWVLEETLEGHSDWVRDVAWAPNVGLPRTYVASCGQDRRVIVWTKDGDVKEWKKTELNAGGLEGNANAEGM
jgi:protein transport protein SEC13